jgi:hypothetical protein
MRQWRNKEESIVRFSDGALRSLALATTVMLESHLLQKNFA